jgi:phosphoserine aminotransferase
VTRWLLDQPGGLLGMARLNEAKARLLYETIDHSSGFYRGHASKADRSLMTVSFRLPSEQLEQAFLRQAEPAGLHGLEGHRTGGGLRASLYNAVTLESVQALCDFMTDFRTTNT